MHQAIKVAVVGYGFSAKSFHLPFIQCQDDYQLVAISSSQAEAIARDLPAVAVYATAEHMIRDCDAELIIITAPNQAHFPLAKLALENHRHVLLEKPFVNNVAEGEQLIELAESNNRLLSVYHNRRWDGDFLTVKKLLQQGKLGQLRYYESHFDRFRPQVQQRWREAPAEGGGFLFDLGSHLIDQSLQLFGWPQAITADCRGMREGAQVVDYFHLQLHYADKVVVLHASPFCAGPVLRFKLEGDAGSYSKYGYDPQEGRLREGRLPDHDGWCDEDAEHYGVLYSETGAQAIATESGGYQHFYQQLARAIQQQAALPVSAVEALQVIRLIELAMQSSRLGQTLPLDQPA
jgi:predicted dehydrogenase